MAAARKRKDTGGDRTVDINELTLDPGNSCIHDDRNLSAIGGSLQEFGAGRSILVDGDGIVRAGNGTVTAAKLAGIQRVRVIETDGTELVAVVRTDLTGARAVAAGLVDNRSSDLHRYDADALQAQLDQIASLELPLDMLALSDADIESLIAPAEQPSEDDAAEDDPPGDGGPSEQFHKCPKCGFEWSTINNRDGGSED